MKVTLLTYGSRGDVEPFVALGQGLLRAGHSVRLAAPKSYESLAAANHEIDFVGLPGDPQRLVQELVDVAGKSRWRMVRAMSRFVLPLAASVFEQVRTACDGADLIVHSFILTCAGYEVARRWVSRTSRCSFSPSLAAQPSFRLQLFLTWPWAASIGDYLTSWSAR